MILGEIKRITGYMQNGVAMVKVIIEDDLAGLLLFQLDQLIRLKGLEMFAGSLYVTSDSEAHCGNSER